MSALEEDRDLDAVGRGPGVLELARGPAAESLVGVALAPAAWFTHLLVSYVLVPVACEGPSLWLHLSTVVAAVAAAGGWTVAVRARRRVPETDRRRSGTRVLANVGVAMSPLFLLVILVAGGASLVVGPCR
ncbi:MAG: hypothetical protein AB1673_15535 [Actinomycetota bacterium]